MKIIEETKLALQQMQIDTFTEVQENVFEHAIGNEDIFALSPTGTGKTLAFVIPILQKIELQKTRKHFPQAIILTPTRELSIQIADIIRTVVKNREGIRTAVLTGGVDIQKQILSFRNGADIVVGTPSRIKDHLRRHTLKTKECRILVCDEADEMLTMGFENDIFDIANALPPHQTMFFCATTNNKAEDLANALLHDPFIYKAEIHHTSTKPVILLTDRPQDKIDVLLELFQKEHDQILLFANTRKTCDFLTELFQKKNQQIDTIHSEMDYAKRKKIMESFRNHDLKILCATDVAARGIDIPQVKTVILFDPPETKDQYIHRIGRVNRMRNDGKVYVLLTKKERKIYSASFML